MSGGTVIVGGLTVGMAAAGAATAIGLANGISGLVGGGAAPGVAGQGGGGGGLTVMQQQYAMQGPAPGHAPTIGGSEKVNNFKEMSSPKATEGKAASVYNLRSTPTQAVGQEQANSEFKDVWADRLSRYLDYNTRSLG